MLLPLVKVRIYLINLKNNFLLLAELLAVGSYRYDDNKETEIYSFGTNQWRRLQQFPYGSGSSLQGMAAVYLKGYFYTFGGVSGGYLNNIARLDPIQGNFLLNF